MAPKIGLGRGLDALIPAKDMQPSRSAEERAAASGVIELPVGDIRPNPHQPRLVRGLDEQQLAELAASIREHGVIQPLIVVKSVSGAKPWTLIAGERRWRASQIAGLTTVPAIVKDYAPQQMLEVALIENIQRSDLSPLEEAEAYQHLMTDFGLRQNEVAQRVGKSREDVANTVRLLQLPESVQSALMQGEITEGHARALLSPKLTMDQQLVLFEEVRRGKLSVRQTEELVRRMTAAPQPHKPLEPQVRSDMRDLESQLRNALGTKVSLQRSRKGGRLVIEFYSDEEFDALYARIVGEEQSSPARRQPDDSA
jgi:ParB family chromosome partitioning protein